MRVITRRTVYESRSDVFRLIVLSDIHLGNRHCDEKQLKQIIQEIAVDPFCYWIGLGDMCEFINLRDPRFDPLELVPWLLGGEQLRDIGRAEMRRFIELTRPIAGKCLALCEGNHEWAILQHSETDVYSGIIEGLADPLHEHRLDHRGFVAWQFERQKGHVWTLRIHATHGSNGGRGAGATANRLEDLVDQMDGVDVILQGHTHKAMHLPVSKWRLGQREATRTTIHALNAPALCSDMAYADRRDMRPVAIGYAELIIMPDRERIEVHTRVS